MSRVQIEKDGRAFYVENETPKSRIRRAEEEFEEESGKKRGGFVNVLLVIVGIAYIFNMWKI